MKKIILAAATAMALVGTGQAAAFQTPVATPTEATAAQTKLPDGTTAEERSNTARLNAEQAARAKAEITTYEQEVSAVAQQVAHDLLPFFAGGVLLGNAIAGMFGGNEAQADQPGAAAPPPEEPADDIDFGGGEDI